MRVCVCLCLTVKICNNRLWDCAFMNRRFGDSASSHWLLSPQCASPSGRPSVSLLCWGKGISSSAWISSPRLPASASKPPSPPFWHALTARSVFRAAAKRRRRCVGVWFLCSCLVLKGRSQLLILRCKEKVPCREVRDRLRNWIIVFYLQTFKRAFYSQALF